MSRDEPDTRTRILETTARILEQHGGRGVRMADIAKQAGISRQAVYLHFASRAELLVATTRFIDARLGLEKRLVPSRAAGSGSERLALFVDFWGNYIPQIYPVAKALLLVLDSDEAAAEAWRDRMAALRDGCQAAVDMLHEEDKLADAWTTDTATDALWTMLSVENWEHLTAGCGWSNAEYVARMKTLTERALVRR